MPKLVVGTANEDVEPIRASRHRCGPAYDGGTEILRRIPIRAVVCPMQHGLAGRSDEDVQPVHAPGGHARSRVEGAARSFQSLHCGLLPDGAAENVAGRSLNGFGGGGPRRYGRDQEEPVPASSSTTLAKITRSIDRRCVLIMWGSTTAPYLPGADLSASRAATEATR